MFLLTTNRLVALVVIRHGNLPNTIASRQAFLAKNHMHSKIQRIMFTSI